MLFIAKMCFKNHGWLQCLVSHGTISVSRKSISFVSDTPSRPNGLVALPGTPDSATDPESDTDDPSCEMVQKDHSSKFRRLRQYGSALEHAVDRAIYIQHCCGGYDRATWLRAAYRAQENKTWSPDEWEIARREYPMASTVNPIRVKEEKLEHTKTADDDSGTQALPVTSGADAASPAPDDEMADTAGDATVVKTPLSYGDSQQDSLGEGTATLPSNSAPSSSTAPMADVSAQHPLILPTTAEEVKEEASADEDMMADYEEDSPAHSDIQFESASPLAQPVMDISDEEDSSPSKAQRMEAQADNEVAQEPSQPRSRRWKNPVLANVIAIGLQRKTPPVVPAVLMLRSGEKRKWKACLTTLRTST